MLLVTCFSFCPEGYHCASEGLRCDPIPLSSFQMQTRTAVFLSSSVNIYTFSVLKTSVVVSMTVRHPLAIPNLSLSANQRLFL